ncbi:hypothetical protein JCM8547_006033 [Rhodosporidiobolus lusitaniae]
MATELVASLASLTGLDQETAASILPHLDSLPAPHDVQIYLESLLAPGPASQSFIQQYTAQRFPSARPSPSPASHPQPPSASTRRWGASPSSSSANPRSNSPLPPPTSASRADQAQKLEKAFAGAGGKVYVKEKEEDLGGWGGGGGVGSGGKSKSGSAANSRGSSASRGGAGAGLAPPVPVVAVPSPASSSFPSSAVPSPSPRGTGASSPAPPAAGSKAAKGKGKQPQAEEVGLELSEEAVKELGEIERALKSFQPNGGRAKGKEVKCFCAARLHPLSPYTPLCPHCSLVLCSLNTPSSPCPSCSHSPLLPPSSSASHIATLETRREALIEREKARVRREKEQAERERAAIRFPELGADYSGIDRSSQGRGYAAHAGGGGGGMGIRERIEKAYEAGTDLNGRVPEEVRRQREAREGQGKVLRLGANGKVKVQTKRLVPTSSKSSSKLRLEETTVSEIDPSAQSDDESSTAFLDEDDDGVRFASLPFHSPLPLISTRAEREGWAVPAEQRMEERRFARVTFPEEDRPLWTALTAEEQGEGYFDEMQGDEDGSPSAATSPAASRGTAVASPPAIIEPAKRAVPGAAVVKEGGAEGKKKKRARGGGKGKGKEGGEGEGQQGEGKVGGRATGGE